jgi:ribA/ribD-fused uncharacterized protein
MIDRFDKQYRFLSNFYMVPIQFMGNEWPSVEHALQAFKSREKPIRDHIRGLPEARDAKRAGRACVCRDDWLTIRRPLMEQLVRAKFFQHPDLAVKLLETGVQRLIEGNTWHDNEWGDCCCDMCAHKEGQNMLGIILMAVRQELKTLRLPRCQL